MLALLVVYWRLIQWCSQEEQWILKKFKEEVDFVVKWLPHDGTSHESPGYMTFGISHLVTGVHAVDRCLGTKHLEHDFLQNGAKI